MLNVVLETALEEKLGEELDSDITVSYEYDDDSIEFLENLENSAFFSWFYHRNPMELQKFRGIYLFCLLLLW